MAKAKMILVVDDDPNLILFFKEFFKQEGYNALCIDDPEKAIRTANLVHPDLLIFDIKMPKVDGFKVLAKVRENTPAIKTVVVSAFVYGEIENRIKESRIDAVLKKPVKFEDLEHWILKLLEVTKKEIQDKLPPPGERPLVRILFVDDEKEILDAVAETVNEYGFLMDAAKSGEEGLEKLKAVPYDILITDNSMYGMSGYEMIKQIKAESSHVPPVMAVASANLTRELEEKYRGLGVSDFMDKPLRFEEIIGWLESKIPEVVKKKKAAAGN